MKYLSSKLTNEFGELIIKWIAITLHSTPKMLSFLKLYFALFWQTNSNC